MEKIIDIFTFNGEYDLLEIRLNILNDVVDEFIIVEAEETFSGNPKPLYYLMQEARYADWHDKIKYYVIPSHYKNDVELSRMADNSPNVPRTPTHWKNEFMQKESIKNALHHLDDNDICFVGDVDEIWDKKTCKEMKVNFIPRKLKLRVYTYFLNNRSDEKFYGMIVTKYKTIKEGILNHLRTFESFKYEDDYMGYHFTNMGGLEEVRRKLNDSYTSDSYNTLEVQDNLSSRFGNEDYMGRSFTFKKENDYLPKYLLDNKDIWKKLFLA